MSKIPGRVLLLLCFALFFMMASGCSSTIRDQYRGESYKAIDDGTISDIYLPTLNEWYRPDHIKTDSVRHAYEDKIKKEVRLMLAGMGYKLVGIYIVDRTTNKYGLDYAQIVKPEAAKRGAKLYWKRYCSLPWYDPYDYDKKLAMCTFDFFRCVDGKKCGGEFDYDDPLYKAMSEASRGRAK